ncbi:hypothetical protein B0I35DRAFT_464603 [Stachybotrys elegans]|uniref:Phytanoyl-CoA dioxygenase family protein n=1 Tax=Stachybotrys elegans TaxID=80388 RepID=A0A8K0SGQ4_9HYPO|nr:hypothetical protein B0I35DRAFT_464603 [Stachybotrys elegans]
MKQMHHDIVGEVGADKRLGTKGHPSVDPRIQRLISHIDEHGFVILPNVFSEEEINEAKLELERLAAAKSSQPRVSKGRNTFEGVRTQREYSLSSKGRVFDKFALHPDILAFNDHYMEKGYLLNSFQGITIHPGEKAQTLHFDDGYITIPRPHNPFGAAIMVALDPFTADNGATVVIPKSHKWGPDRRPDPSEGIPAVMPAGSVCYFLSTLWHGGGANTSNQSRAALTVQYSQPWIRQLENHMMAVRWEDLAGMPPRLVDLIGYKVGSPFIGHVDGRSPRAVVEQRLQEQQAKKIEDPVSKL